MFLHNFYQYVYIYMNKYIVTDTAVWWKSGSGVQAKKNAGGGETHLKQTLGQFHRRELLSVRRFFFFKHVLNVCETEPLTGCSLLIRREGT